MMTGKACCNSFDLRKHILQEAKADFVKINVEGNIKPPHIFGKYLN